MVVDQLTVPLRNSGKRIDLEESQQTSVHSFVVAFVAYYAFLTVQQCICLCTQFIANTWSFPLKYTGTNFCYNEVQQGMFHNIFNTTHENNFFIRFVF